MKNKKAISNKQIKQMLPEAFVIPQPLERDIFLKNIKENIGQQSYISQLGISNKEFILIQARYIRKSTWCLSVMLFLFTLIGIPFLNQDILWPLAAFIPFLAICGVTENLRSENYGMAELEQATRFSLRSVMFARIGILGTVHFALLVFLILMLNQNGTNSLLQTAVYLMVPYFMTTFSGLWISRKIHGKESVYACMGAAAMVSMLQNVLGYMGKLIDTADLFQWWLVGLLLLIIFTIKELKIMFIRAEGIA